MDLGFGGRRVLIVGGSYGIGFAAARQMAEEGGEVILASRSLDNLRKAADGVAAGGVQRPHVIVADVTQPGAAEGLLADVGERWDRLDGLVCAVGGSIRSAFADLSDEAWMENYRFNIVSAVTTIRAALPHLRRGREPSVVVLGAAAAKMPYAHQIVSNVHKAGLLGLVKTLSAELAADGIRVNLVGPGRTLTNLWQSRADKMAAERGVTRDEIIAEFSREIPLGRFASADEVAVMVTWLTSPLASYVTGQSVNVDGGIARGLL